MDSDEEEEKKKTKGPKFPIQMYISEGNKHRMLAKYDTAIGFFETALEREPNNEKCLIGRSLCRMRLARFSEAKEDAEAALKVNPKSCVAKILIGEADYFLGDFENAFLTFYRGHSLRLKNEGLKFGHQMCRKAIDNALQPDKPIILDDQDVASLSNLEKQKDEEMLTKLKIQKGLFSSDVHFVDTLLDDDVLESVHPHCEYLKTYLRDRQMFWRTQNPNTSKRSKNMDTRTRKSEDNNNQGMSASLEHPEKLQQSENVEQDAAFGEAKKCDDDASSSSSLVSNNSEEELENNETESEEHT